MPKYTIYYIYTKRAKAWAVVEADSKDEALEIFENRGSDDDLEDWGDDITDYEESDIDVVGEDENEDEDDSE